MAQKKLKEWRVYKPKKTNDGAASKLELRVDFKEKPPTTKDSKPFLVRKVLVFWVSAKQTGVDANGNASFGWDDPTKNVTIKLGEVDLGELLAVFAGAKPNTGQPEDKGLFHKNERGSTSFNLKRNDAGGYYVKATKKFNNEPAVQISHTLTYGEAEVLRLLVESAVRQTYLW